MLLAEATRLEIDPGTFDGGGFRMHIMQSRRDFLAGLSAASAASIVSAERLLADQGPPETTTLRIGYDSSICVAPNFIAEGLLRAEGFTEIHYMPHSLEAVARGDYAFDFDSVAGLLPFLDAGEPMTVLAGLHSGCYELFAREPIRTIGELKGRRVGVSRLNVGRHLFLKVVAAYVGLDPDSDIDWVTSPDVKPAELFKAGKIDAFLGFPPEPQELRARNIGRVILNTATDKPWSQYYCCMCVANTDYVREHPIATKRVLRAFLKAAEICATEPATAARRLVEAGYTPRYDYALQALTELQTLAELPYSRWREVDPEDSIRFYALRFHEVGAIRSSPNQLIAEGTNWRFLNELKRELKG
jgi:NitT/TauT family transport system substrate-binding protein